MERIKNKTLLALIGFVFALFLGLNAYSFAFCLASQEKQIAWSIEKSAPAEVLENNVAAQQLYSRLRQMDDAQGGGRDLPHSKVIDLAARKFAVSFCLRVSAVTRYNYGSPKDFYIYTLKRILC